MQKQTTLRSVNQRADKTTEAQQRIEQIKNSTIKNLRRKNLEGLIEKQILQQQHNRLQQNQAELNNAMQALKKITLGIILRLAGSMFQSLLSLGSCVVYVFSTYYNESKYDDVFNILEIIISSLFAIDYAFGFFNAKNKKKFFFTQMNLIDLITIIPVFTIYIPGVNYDSDGGKFIKVVRVLRVLRVLRLYRLFYSSGPDQLKGSFTESSEVKRKILLISATIMAIVFIATGIIYQFNYMDVDFSINVPNSLPLTFDNTFYYMIVTVCTVGYGDFYPITDFSRIVIGIFIVLIIVLVSKQTSELNELMKFSSEYKIPYRGGPGKNILLLGNISANTLNKFLKEFYHPDHNMKEEMKVVIVQEKEPSREILSVLTNPKYQESLHFIVGNIFREQIMRMAKVKDTKVFILCNQFSADSKKDDIFALLATKAIHDYDPNCKIFVQMVDPDFLLHSWADWDVVMSTQAYKMGIIAQNAFNQGFCTFICNLIMSTSISSGIQKKFPEWVVKYCDGLSQEFYVVPFSNDVDHRYVGKSFSHAVDDIYSKHGILLIGVRSLSSSDNSEVCYYDVIMNPMNYTIKQSDEGIMICNDQETANAIWGDEPTFQPLTVSPNVRLIESEVKNWISKSSVKDSEGSLTNDHYFMWETDLRGVIKNHLIIFGQLDHLPALLTALKHYSNQHICFVSDKSPDERWGNLRRNFPNVYYLESSLSDVDELSRTAIEDSYHVIMLTWFVQDSSIQDSGILPIVRIIEENFKTVRFTLELLDESNLKYMNYRPRKELGSISYNIWPRYASSNVFFSSTMDYLMAQAFHMESIVEIVGKLINSNPTPNISGIIENNAINLISIPDEYHKYKYYDFFKQFITLDHSMIPLAIIRDKQEGKNEIPVVLINPPAETHLMKGDKLLMMGNPTIEQENNIDDEKNLKSSQVTKISQNQIISNIQTNDDLLLLAKQMIEEDELLNTQDQYLSKKIEEELGMSSQNRQELLKLNEELKAVVLDIVNLKKKYNQK